MSDVHCLFRPGDGPRAPGNGLPRGNARAAVEARQDLGDFLDAHLPRPLWFNNAQQQEQIGEALEMMSIAERVAIEIQMSERRRIVHSFDYDPLR